MTARRRCDDGCAEPGCGAPWARGSYCEAHAGIYYDATRPMNLGLHIASADRIEAKGHALLPAAVDLAAECGHVAEYQRQRQRRAIGGRWDG